MASESKRVKGVRWEKSDAVVELCGEVDLHHTPEVHRALVTTCERRPPRLIIDLSAVSYMDSSGIGTLVEVFRRVNGYSGKLILCGLNERVRSVFEITRLDKFFRTCGTVEEALLL